MSCVHGNKLVTASGCGRCVEEMLAARALCRALGAAPAEVLSVLQECFASDEAWKAAVARAKARLAEKGIEYAPLAAAPVTVADVAGVKR